MAKSWREHAEEAIQAFQVDPKQLDSDAKRREAAESLSRTVAGIAGAVALQPLPIADIALLLPIQTALILKIAQIYQVPLDWRRTQAITAVAITGMLAKRFVGALAKLAPGIGTVASVPIAYYATLSMGKAAAIHFASGGGADYRALKQALRKKPAEPIETLEAGTDQEQASTPRELPPPLGS